MIAHDTGHTYIDEARFGIWDGKRAISVAKVNSPCVIQGPGLLERAAFFDNVILMKRDVGEIAMSLARTRKIAERLFVEYPEVYLANSGRRTILPILMHALFYRCTASRVKNLIEVSYEMLDQHPLWVPKEDRVDWKNRQWTNMTEIEYKRMYEGEW
jgi:hypothetical protein